MLLSFFQLSLAVRNVWPKHMSLKAFLVLYMLLVLAGMPVTLLACIPYGLFGMPVAVCIFGLIACRDTAAQNIGMGMIGVVLAVITDNLLANILDISVLESAKLRKPGVEAPINKRAIRKNMSLLCLFFMRVSYLQMFSYRYNASQKPYSHTDSHGNWQ